MSHDGVATSSIANTATATRAGGLGGEMLESAAACCVGVVPGPTTAVPEPPAWFPKSDPTALGSGDTKMESDSGDGLIDGLRRRWRETPAGMACRVDPTRARASACMLSAHGT